MTDYLGKAARYAGLAAGVGFILWFLMSGRASTMLSCNPVRDTTYVYAPPAIHDTGKVVVKKIPVLVEDRRRIDSVVARMHETEKMLQTVEQQAAYKDSIIMSLLSPVRGEKQFITARPNLYMSERIAAISRPIEGILEIERSIDSLSFTAKADTIEIPPNYVPYVIGSVLGGIAIGLWLGK